MGNFLHKISIQCDQCNYINEKYTAWIALDKDTSILKAIWCDYCNIPLAVRFIFDENNSPKIIKQLDRKEVFMPQKVETGITIKPRGKKPKKETKSNE